MLLAWASPLKYSEHKRYANFDILLIITSMSCSFIQCEGSIEKHLNGGGGIY